MLNQSLNIDAPLGSSRGVRGLAAVDKRPRRGVPQASWRKGSIPGGWGWFGGRGVGRWRRHQGRLKMTTVKLLRLPQQTDTDIMTTAKSAPQLEFSGKYNNEHAKQYLLKHDNGLWRRLSNLRDHQIARKALSIAGNPKTVLDAPCGTGRFWDVLVEQPGRIVHACDYSQNMIDVGMASRPKEITQRIRAFQASVFDMPVEDNFVECVFCIRFVHHLGENQDRLTLLRELHRVTSDTVILSLWVDGSIKAWSRKRLEKKRKARSYQNRFVIPKKTIEHEFDQCGFDMVAHLDFSRTLSMWRTYVLRKRA